MSVVCIMERRTVGFTVYRLLIVLATLNFVVIKGQVVSQLTPPRNFSEGPVWDECNQVLYYVDAYIGNLHRLDMKTMQEQVVSLGREIGFLVPIRGRDHQFIISLNRDLVLLTWDYDGDQDFYTTCLLVSVDACCKQNRWNDGKADAFGRIWAGTLGPSDPEDNFVPNLATFYRVNTLQHGRVRADVEVKPVTLSNGLVWSVDNRVLYYIDTLTYRVDAFNFDLLRGSIRNRRPIFSFKKNGLEGRPDGMTIDTDGNLWIASNGGGEVVKVNPNTGELLQRVHIPVTRTTSVAFGGPALDILYVTTATSHNTTLNDLEPLAGAVFKVTGLGVTGTLMYRAILNSDCTPIYHPSKLDRNNT